MTKLIETSEGSALRGFYWALRSTRGGRRRTIYRRIKAERERLVKLGENEERVRLYCLFLADPKREVRFRRFESVDISVTSRKHLKGALRSHSVSRAFCSPFPPDGEFSPLIYSSASGS